MSRNNRVTLATSNECHYLRGIKGGWGGVLRTYHGLKVKKNASRWIKIRVHVSRLFSKIHSSLLSSLLIVWDLHPSADFSNRVLFQSGILDNAFPTQLSNQCTQWCAAYASVNSRCAQPPFPGLLRGICPSFPGVGHSQILHCPGAGHLPTPGPFPSFWHARSFLWEYNDTEGFSGKNADWPI